MLIEKQVIGNSEIGSLKHYIYPFCYPVETKSSTLVIPTPQEKTTLISASLFAMGLCLAGRFALKLKSRYVSPVFFLVGSVGTATLYYNSWISKCSAFNTIQKLQANFKSNVSVDVLFKTLHENCRDQNRQTYLIQAFNMHAEEVLKTLPMDKNALLELRDTVQFNDVFQNLCKTLALLIKLNRNPIDKISEPEDEDNCFLEQLSLNKDNLKSTIRNTKFTSLFTQEVSKILEAVDSDVLSTNVMSYLGLLSSQEK